MDQHVYCSVRTVCSDPAYSLREEESVTSQGNLHVKLKTSYNHSRCGFIKNNVFSVSLYSTLEFFCKDLIFQHQHLRLVKYNRLLARRLR